MRDPIRSWLNRNATILAHQTLAELPHVKVDVREIEDFILSVAQCVHQPSASQQYTIQLWLVRIVGGDTAVAQEWLLVFPALKINMLANLSDDWSAAEAVAHWPNVDQLFDSALVETARVADGSKNPVLLDHILSLRQQMEQIEQTKTKFIQVAAHELKTPLTLLEGYANMMRDAVPEEQALLQMYIAGLDGGTYRLREIIGDMIDLSMIRSGAIDISFQLVYLDRIAEQVASRLRPAYEQRQVGLTVEPFPPAPVMYGDPERLMQLLSKIMSNALKYTPDGGQVTVRATRTPHKRADGTVDTAGFDGYLTILVEDNGIGIDPKNLNLIFDAFGSLNEVATHSSGKTKFKGGGPGLGLPIARGIVEAHGGRIWAESEGFDERKRPGSIFHVELPCWTGIPSADKLAVRQGNA
ncbi:MAG: HAMP domain-containing histidine kinase [Anaerolineales bacterium]|nr:HAMP domain-containing histidine kinase [Anaerolineales bacterium]